MSARINDAARSIIRFALLAVGFFLHLAFVRRARNHFRNQDRLRAKYGVTDETPIRGFDAALQESLQSRRHPKGDRIARTSGSTNRSKELVYSRSRLRRASFQFVDVFARAFYFLRPRKTGLFIFAPNDADDSLTSLLVEETDGPSWISALQAPYRLLKTPPFRRLESRYDLDAIRLFLLVLTEPGVFYATNPSTLLAFFQGLEKNGPSRLNLLRDFVEKPQMFPRDLHRAVRRVESRGFKERARNILARGLPLDARVLFPSLEIYSCWTGGYVAPYLDALAAYLPRTECRLLPMYSMSTETVETITDCSSGEPRFLPLAIGVLAEFLEEGLADDPALLTARPEPGKTYALVVSDPYGLKRYQTEDLFFCRSISRGLPDLIFQRRRGLEYSLTGEKITGEQLQTVFDGIRPALGIGERLTCFPSAPEGERPHYKLILVSESPTRSRDLERFAELATSALAEANPEFRAKIASGRLGSFRAIQVAWDELVFRATGKHQAPSQFKTLPLYRKLWEKHERL